jgi:hypothetical protein
MLGAQVKLNTTSACELAVSVYPMFSYNAAGGGGSGTVTDLGNGKLQLIFDAAGGPCRPSRSARQALRSSAAQGSQAGCGAGAQSGSCADSGLAGALWCMQS